MAGILIILIIVFVFVILGALVYHGILARKPKPNPFDHPIDPKLWKQAEEKVKMDRRVGIKYSRADHHYKKLWNELHNGK